MAALLPSLKALGIETETRGLPWLRFGFAGDFEATVLHRALPGRFALGRLRRAARRLIFDVDRAVFLRRSARGISTSRGALSRFATIVGAADAVTVSNPYLAAHARRFVAEDWRVKVAPDGIDLTPWKPRERALDPKGRIVLGWMGPASRFPDLATLAGSLRRLCELFAGLELRIVSDVPAPLDGVRATFVPRRPGREAEEVAGFDIALALYDDDAMSMGETPREVLGYLASGVPIVASDSLALRPMLKDHHNALLAQTPDEWERKIGLLIEAADLGRELGRNARRTAEKVYAADRVVRGFASILKSVVSPEGSTLV